MSPSRTDAIEPDLFGYIATPDKPTINADGVSVKDCSCIYAPQGRAEEYAPLAANPYRGCGHECRIAMCRSISA